MATSFPERFIILQPLEMAGQPIALMVEANYPHPRGSCRRFSLPSGPFFIVFWRESGTGNSGDTTPFLEFWGHNPVFHSGRFRGLPGRSVLRCRRHLRNCGKNASQPFGVHRARTTIRYRRATELCCARAEDVETISVLCPPNATPRMPRCENGLGLVARPEIQRLWQGSRRSPVET